LFDHKRVSPHKTDTTTAQFPEEYDPTGIRKGNVRQIEGQLNLLGESMHIACSAKLLDKGTRYPALYSKGHGTSRRFDNGDPQHRDFPDLLGLDKAIDMPFIKSGYV
jgi:hypothetical protein